MAVQPARSAAIAVAALLLSLSLHGALLGAIALHFLDPAPPPPIEATIPIEMIVVQEPELAPDPLAGAATAEPLVPVAAPEAEPEVAAEAVPEPLPEPEHEVAAEAGVAPFPEPEAVPEAILTTEQEPLPQPETVAEAAPDVLAEAEPEPETAAAPAPEPLEEIEPERAPEAETAPSPEPVPIVEAPTPQIAALPPPPLPDRRPEPVQATTAEAAAQPDPPESTAALADAAETPPEVETEAQQSEAPLPPSRLTTPATPQGLLANLAALTDEAARAKANPELWAIVTAVRTQIRQCWLLSPEEMQDPALSVEIAVAFEKDGRLLRADIQDAGRMVRDRGFKSLAVTAHRALQACSPFDLPADRYATWKSFTLRFVPHEPT